ncbi:MAG: hypothetical protein J6S27_06185, partial [Thermoguttaceae bacterium]|nr:hypothetical protein [Thermoguttaceae bacterium]
RSGSVLRSLPAEDLPAEDLPAQALPAQALRSLLRSGSGLCSGLRPGSGSGLCPGLRLLSDRSLKEAVVRRWPLALKTSFGIVD